MKPLLISSGEPAGIGPDLCLALAFQDFPVVVLGDLKVLEERAKELQLKIKFSEYDSAKVFSKKSGTLSVISIPCSEPVVSGHLNSKNSPYVIELLKQSAIWCQEKKFSALVTAPVHKAIINEAGIDFTGHTEFFADLFAIDTVVMMLACAQMRVALITTHLPLRDVPAAITPSLITKVITQLHYSLIEDFNIKKPRIKVAGLNPHAGESGYLGREEIEVISPALEELRKKGLDLIGPLPADTMFTKDQSKQCDAYVAMYHDQGLPVLKYVGFNQAVNVTLGLPIIRTSVDHGTALELAGKGTANADSLVAAVKMAMGMAQNRELK